jgi:uncharacterized protein YkwD
MGPLPIVQPEFRQKVKDFPQTAVATAKNIPALLAHIKFKIPGKKSADTRQSHIPPPWVFEPPPNFPPPDSQPTGSRQQPSPTSPFHIPTFFPQPSTEPTRQAQPTSVQQPTRTPTTPPVNEPPPSTEGNMSYESQILDLVNQQRSNLGHGPVQMQENLRAAARIHSTDMAEKRFCNHQGSDQSWPQDRTKRAGYRGGLIGETIGCGHRSAASIVDAWMRSDGHRAILMDSRARLIGIGWVNNRQTAVVGY